MPGRHALLLALILLLCVPSIKAETIPLNINDAEITAVIAMVAEQTGKNFIIDPRVRGRVTVVTSSPVPRDALYAIFLEVLKIHGFAAIEGEGAIRIVPDALAKHEDVPTVDGTDPHSGETFVTRVIDVHHVGVAQLVPILRPLVPQRGHLAAFPESNVLIVADAAGNIRRLVELIRRIDRPADEVEVIRLQHASASEVVRILSSLTGAAAEGRVGVRLVADERSNSVLLSGEESRRLRLRALIGQLDMPVDGGGNTHVVYLRYANAESLASVLTGLAGSVVAETGGERGGERQVTIQADEATNALIINAQPDVMRSLRSVIRQLDVRRAQVLVEAIIAEVSADRAAELGVQWGTGGQRDGVNVGVLSQVDPRRGTGQSLTELFASEGGTLGGGLTFGFADLVGGRGNFALLLRALATDGSTNILSTPSILTLDNEEAEIMVGQNVPFVTGRYTQAGDTATPTNPFQTIQRQDVGITLRVRPQINEGNAIRLAIEQEVSTLTRESTVGGEITNRRFIRTNVMVGDGQLIVLGGLMDEDHQERQQRVPGLGSMPLLGALFRQEDARVTKRNLMVFMRPIIMHDDTVADAITGSKYNFIRAQQLEAHTRGVALMPQVDSPVLPELKSWMTLPPPFDPDQAEVEPRPIRWPGHEE